MQHLSILYRDQNLIAIDKPSGLLVHRSMIDKHETRFAIQQLRDQIGQRVFPLHRLDKPTSGVLLFALSSEAAREMGALFETNKIHKRYLAVVRGYTLEQDSIDYPLREQPDRMTDSDAAADKPAREARTDLRRLATLELNISDGRHPTSRYSLIEATPHTGRKHQIRRHLKHIFHPLIGDTTHGDGRHNRLFREYLHSQRLLLCAHELSFTHPYSSESITIQAPLDAEFLRIVNLFKTSQQQQQQQ